MSRAEAFGTVDALARGGSHLVQVNGEILDLTVVHRRVALIPKTGSPGTGTLLPRPSYTMAIKLR